MPHVYRASCHCGRVKLTFAKPAPVDRLIDCNCTICTKKGVLHTPVLEDEVTSLEGADDLALYRFGSGVAEHRFCRHCGIHVYGRPRSAPERLTVNARCLDNFAEVLATAERIVFDGQNHPKDLVG